MRLSAEKNSPHYRPDFWQWFVTVDGVRVNSVVEASEEEGWADVVSMNDAGVIDVDGDEVLLRRLSGHVVLSKSIAAEPV